MNIEKEIEKKTNIELHMYMERYVNDGSPSGFSFTYSTSKQYSPKYGARSFELNLFRTENIHLYGKNEHNIFSNCIAIHPDDFDIFKNRNDCQLLNKTVSAIPSSSPRTILTNLEGTPYFLKLHYSGILC